MTVATYQDPQASVDDRLADLLAQMTLEEKVAQLGAVWALQLVTEDVFDESAASNLMASGIGQITRLGGSTGLLPEDSAAFMNQIQRFAVERTRLGIPVLLHEEALGGLAHRGATTFPQALGLAATWDPALVGEVAEVIREQMLAVGARLALAPVLDIARDPRWGRTEETYGESPELTAQLGIAFVRGMQGADLATGVACAAKHFLGYAASIGGRNQAPVHLGPRELRDVHAAPFGVVIRDAGLAGVMNSYASVDGVPCVGSREILTDLLRGELGFDGAVVADYFAVNQLVDDHRTAVDRTDAALEAISAGLDVELPSLEYYKELPGLVRSGRLSERTVDTAVQRVLAQKFRLGLFDHPYVDSARAASRLDTSEHRDLARRAAAESVCLLTNDGVLPLQLDELRTVAVIGPHADDPRLLQGDYHYPAHHEIMYLRSSTEEAALEGLPALESVEAPARLAEVPREASSFQPGPYFTRHVTPLAGLRELFGEHVSVGYSQGCHDSNPDDKNISEAVSLASAADVALVFVGSKSGLVTDCTSGEMRDVVSLDLPGAQHELVTAVTATGTPTVVIVVSGRVHTLQTVTASANAVLWAAPPGEEGGRGITDVLTGTINPSGRLPVTLPRHVGQLPLHHDMRARGERSEIYGDYVDCPCSPLFPFGHGLSYTAFDYGDLRIEPGTTASRTIVVLEVLNSGACSGEEVVQLYVRDKVASVARPSRELIGFARVGLRPSESVTITFEIPAGRLAFHNRSMQRVTEPGDFTFMVGASSTDIRAEATVELTGHTVIHPLSTSEMTACHLDSER